MAEVAGLVLGGLPLLVSALEHYEDCYNVLESMMDFRLEYRKARNRLRQLVAVHDSTLTLLLLDMVELEALKSRVTDRDITNHKIEATDWSDLDAKLKKRLRPAIYPEYLQAMKDLSGAIARLIHDFGADKPLFQEHWSTKEGKDQSRKRSFLRRSQTKVLYEAQRIRFTFGKTKRDHLISEVEGYNRTLETLLSQNDEIIKQLARAKYHPGYAAQQGLLGFWSHARNIYELLRNSWICACRQDHCVDLRLEYRTTSKVHMEIFFQFDHEPSLPLTAPWRRHKTLVTHGEKIHEPTACAVVALASQNDQISAMSATGSGLAPGTKPLVSAMKHAKKLDHPNDIQGGKRPVTFVIDQAPSASRAATDGSSVQASYPHLNQELRDFCRSIGEHCSSKPCCGVLRTANADTHYIVSSPLEGQPEKTCLEVVTLATLLTDPNVDFDRASRYSVAVTVASSHLQLHSSDWLGEQWSSVDIVFAKVSRGVDLEHPLLRKGLSDGPGPSKADNTLLTLGVLLMELCFGMQFEQSPPRRALYAINNPMAQEVLVLAAALTWAERVEKEAGAEYARAVDWCLHTRSVKAHNSKSWRRDFQQEVIEPLQTCSEQLNPPPA